MSLQDGCCACGGGDRRGRSLAHAECLSYSTCGFSSSHSPSPRMSEEVYEIGWREMAELLALIRGRLEREGLITLGDMGWDNILE